MKKIINHITDRLFEFERGSAVSLFVLSLFLAMNNISQSQQINTYIWSSLLMIASLVQFVGIRYDKIIIRMIGAWFSFLVWTWLAFAAINMFLYVTAFCIGIFNILIFISLSHRVQFEWVPQND